MRDTNRVNKLPILQASGVNNARQAGTDKIDALMKSDRVETSLAEVLAVYSDRNTCDIKSLRTGGKHKDVPCLTKGGLIDDEVYGEIDLPAVGDRVILMFLESRETLPMIVGFIFPFLHSKYASGTPVKSSSKAHTTTFFEENKPKTYKKIFKSGTTIEVQEDGSLIIETPGGNYLHINETDGEIIIEDVTNSNKMTMDSSGLLLEDANGNDIAMAAGKVTINSNWEVSQ